MPGVQKPHCQRVTITEGLLEFRERLRRSQTFDCLHLRAIGLNSEHQARARGPPIHDDRAGAAHAMFAADMRTRQPDALTQEIGKVDAGLDLGLDGLTVDGQN